MVARVLLIFMVWGVFGGCAIDEEAIRQRSALKTEPNSSAVLKTFPEKTPEIRSKGTFKPYILGVEDVVHISVVNKPSLNTEQAVRPDGKISFYPMGDMPAAGLTVEELRKNIIQGLKTEMKKPYVLGVQDVIQVSVFGSPELGVKQAIRPDGSISILPGEDIPAAGLTVEELRKKIKKKLVFLLKDPIINVVVEEYNSRPILIHEPIVNVVVEEYNSRKVSILGSVERPGLLKLKSDTTLIEGISLMGGLTKDADLRRAMIFRDQELLPVNFRDLFKKGDIHQNILLEANDAIFIPSTQDNKVYVIGEVQTPGAISWEGMLTLLESISLAGGYTQNAQNKNVLVIKGGLVEPQLQLVDAQSITREGKLENNMVLQSGDIVYVPETTMASLERYFEFASKILQPILSTESSIVLGQSVKDVLTGNVPGVGTSVNVNP